MFVRPAAVVLALLFSFALFGGFASAVKSGRVEGVNLPGGLNLRIQRRKLGQTNSWQSSYSVFGELQHYKSAFLYFPAPYTVQDGDTLSSIAEHAQQMLAVDVTVDELRQMNEHLGLPEADAQLPLRLALNVPGYPAVPPAPTTLSVSDSATLMAFLQAYGIPVEHLQDENPGMDVEKITKLTTVRIPDIKNYPLPACPSSALCVGAGETLADAAQQLGQPVEELLLANEHVLRQGGRLFIGQALTVGTGNHLLPSTVTITKFQNPYQVLLGVPNLPLTPSFLSKLSKANNLSMTKLLTVSDKDMVVVVPSLRSTSDPLSQLSATPEESARVLEEDPAAVELTAPLTTPQPVHVSSAGPVGYRRRVLHPLLKPIALDDDDDEVVPAMQTSAATHAGAHLPAANFKDLVAETNIEDDEAPVVATGHADSYAASGSASSALTAEYIKSFAQTVLGDQSSEQSAVAVGEVDDDEEEMDSDLAAHAVSIGDLGSIITAATEDEGDAMSPSLVRAAAKMAIGADELVVANSGAEQGNASNDNLVVKLLSLLKDETHDPRVEQMLEEFGTSSIHAKHGARVLQQAHRLGKSDMM